MKILYCTPYEGEEDIVIKELAEHDVVFTNDPIQSTIPSEHLDADVLSIFVNSSVTKEMIDSLKNLKIIALRSTGYDHVDYSYAKGKGIVVSYVPHYGSQTVAEYAFALILGLSRKAYAAYYALRTDGLRDVKKFEGFDLKGKTLGVIGTGAIGKNVCAIANGFGMNVIAYDLYPDNNFAEKEGITYKSFSEVLGEADIVTLHVPSSDDNKHMINTQSLEKSKKGLYLINTARGDLIDTVALAKSLESGHLAGAGLDVYEGEKFITDEMELLTQDTELNESVWKAFVAEHALLDMPNVIVTPHVAFNSIEAKLEITQTTTSNILAALNNTPINEVSVDNK